MPKFTRKQALVAKLEVTPGTDSAPTGAANAMLVRNLKLSPLKQQLIERDLAKAWLGQDASIQVASWKMLEFEVEMAGAGAAGTAPRCAPLLQACGFDETVNAGVSVVYTLVSADFDSLTMWTEYDGVVHRMTFARGTVALTLDSRGVPVYRFAFTGLFVPVIDSAITGVSYAGYVKPLAVNRANTTLSLHAYAAIVDKLTLDLKNTVPYRNMIGLESVEITQRLPEGSITLENTSVAAQNWWTRIAGNTPGTLEVIHGTTAGNIVEIDCPAVVLQEPEFGDVDGIQMLQMKLKLESTGLGNNELTITVR